MSLDKISEDTVQALESALSADLSTDEREQISKILQNAMIKSVEQATKSHRAATVICCGPEADLAHKIAEEMSLANKALIANLMAMR